MRRREATNPSQTPAELGFRMPAEWERHEATWLAWPHNRTDWPGKLAAVHWVYGEIVRKLASGETVRILVRSARESAQVRRLLSRIGVNLGRLELFRVPTDRGWVRDCGPIFLRRKGSPPEVAPGIAIVRFRFNAWARYRDWRKDDAVPLRIARTLGFRLFPVSVNGRDLVLEGGSIEVNGRGTLLTTEQCLLDPRTQVRNPGLGRQEYEAAIRCYLGVTNVLWLGDGLLGDDTHGHVDDLSRFVGPRTVVLCQEKDPHDANYRALAENRERLEGMRLEDGGKLEIVPLPLPAPLRFEGRRLPASYANFYIANSAVLVPTFNDPNDRVALGILGDLFPDRHVVGIHAVDLVWGLGTIHCLTQQQPSVTGP
ncbi:MAG: agmatine deiminase family protein [Nitrospiraceae bacterium]